MAGAVASKMEHAGALAVGAALRRRARKRARSGIRLVLAYHGMSVPGRPLGLFPPRLDVTTFRGHLDHLNKRYEIRPLRAIVRSEPQPESSRPQVALTFDDDLRSHLDVVAPMLADRGMQATFFLTGSSLDGSGFREWWHDVEALVERGEWERACTCLARRWPWATGAAPREFAATVLRLDPSARRALAAVLRELVGEDSGDPGLDAAGVGELAGGGFDIGFHTRDHEPLDTQDDTAIRSAMTVGLSDLEAAAGIKPKMIAYPHGRADLRAVHAAEAAGFEFGFGISEDRAIAGTDRPLMLPRIDPTSGSPSVEAFSFRLARIELIASRGVR